MPGDCRPCGGPLAYAYRHSSTLAGLPSDWGTPLKRTFTPPLEEPAGGELVLLVRAAAPDRTGTGVLATLEAWNGTLVHTARVDLSSDLTRRRFIKAVTQRCGAVDEACFEAALMKLSSQL